VAGILQFSLASNCTHSNPYFDEFRYKSNFGNFTLTAAQGGGPANLQIWCHLRDTSWWLDPIFDEVHHILQLPEGQHLFIRLMCLPLPFPAKMGVGPSTSRANLPMASKFNAFEEREKEAILVDIGSSPERATSEDLIQLQTPKKGENFQSQRPSISTQRPVGKVFCYPFLFYLFLD
jgi:hypothetical protein